MTMRKIGIIIGLLIVFLSGSTQDLRPLQNCLKKEIETIFCPTSSLSELLTSSLPKGNCGVKNSLRLKFEQNLASCNGLDLMTGFRASRLLGNYPNYTFPSAEYWTSVGEQMSDKFDNSTPVGIWIVGLYQDNGYCSLSFPNTSGETYENIYFSSYDKDEAFLSHFDTVGMKVFLQVESGAAEIGDLMDLVLGHYGGHPCVIGFGVDVEWYHTNTYPEGEPVSDSLAEAWEIEMKTYNTDYQFFLKHYTTNRMPPNYRGDILFVDDSQDFNFAGNPLEYMVYEYGNWAETFAPNLSAFQFGYPNDQTWWSDFEDPPAKIGQALLDDIPTCGGLFWVDFTVTDVFPMEIETHESRANRIRIFPNPVSDIIYCQIAGITSNEIKWSIISMSGKTLFQGTKNLEGRISDLEIPLPCIENGNYIIQFNLGSHFEQHLISIVNSVR